MNKLSQALAFLLLVATPASKAAASIEDCTAIVPVFTSASFSERGDIGYLGTYLAGRSAAYTNSNGPVVYRNCLVFSLPVFPATLRGAELRLHAFTARTSAPTETWELRQVTNTVSDIQTGLSDAAVYADLGDGPVFGSAHVSTNLNPGFPGGFSGMVHVQLNAAALAALTAAQGNEFIVGGAVTSLGGNVNEEEALFAGSYPVQDYTQLVLNFGDAEPQVATPESEWSITSFLAGEALAIFGQACGAEPLSYQWLRNGAPASGATNSVFSRGSALPIDSGAYQLRVSNAWGVITSPPVAVTVAAMEVFPDLVPATAYLGESLYLVFGVSSLLPVTYEWRRNGMLLAGQTDASLELLDITLADAGDYQVIARNAGGAVTSSLAHVTVEARPPAFWYQPGDVDATAGFPWELNVSASGYGPLIFQWYKDGAPLPGATNDTLFYSSAELSQAGQYYVVVSNIAASATSRVARVTVSAFSYMSGPYDVEALLGNPVSFYSTLLGAPPVHYQWYFYNGLLPGETNSFLSLPAPTMTEAGQYFFIATNIYGSVTSRVATLKLIPQAPTVVAYVGSSQSFPTISPPEYLFGTRLVLVSSVHAGPPAALQWQRDGANLPGQTNSSIDISALRAGDTGDYQLIATNVLGAATSMVIRVTVVMRPPLFGWTPGVSNAVAGSAVLFRGAAYGGLPLNYEWRHNGVTLPGETNSNLLLPALTTNDSGTYEIIARTEAGEARATNVLTVRLPNPLDHWEWRRPPPQGSRLKDIAWGDGRYVAVGRAGNIITSTNGMDWVSVSLDADCELQTVAWGNGLFVAAGWILSPVSSTPYWGYVPLNFYGIAPFMATSPDGLHWMPSAAPVDAYYPDLAFGNGVFVLATYYASPNFCYTSTDGRRWTPVNLNGATSYRVAWGGGRFVAVGSSGFYASTNGVDWSSLGGLGASSLSYGNGLFIGSTSSSEGGRTIGVMQTSTDGTVWEEHRVTNCYAQSFFGGNGRFIGICLDAKGSLVTSADGISWTTVDTRANQELEAGIYADGRFVVVGEAGTVARSVDGATWSLLSTANQIDYYGLAHNGSLVVAAGDSGTILTSTDGRSWTPRVTPTTRNLHALAHGNGLFVAAGRRGALITSPNGIAWTQRSSGVTNYLERVAYANGLWVAVGEQGDLSTSANGLSWTPLNTGEPRTDHEGVAYGNGRWVVVGGYFLTTNETQAVTTIFNSVDGQSWNQAPFSVGKRLRDVTFANGLFVAVGNDGLIATSADSTNWSFYFIRNPTGESNLRRVRYGQGRFVAVGNDGFVVSTGYPVDTSSWITHRPHAELNLHDMLDAPDGTFVAVGNNGMFLQSADARLRITQLRPAAFGWELTFSPGLLTSPLRLEGSTDLLTWGVIATNVVSPIIVPATDARYRFFRLAAP